jgi:CDP-diacylglycerol--glycerol-3-phosphate 3-phosphatidyltransferase
VPNVITVGRLVLGGFLLAAIAYERYQAALVLFVVAAVTDAVDGYLARRLNQATAIGRQLDPLVDKLLVAGALIYLVAIPGTGLAPWMVTLIVARELLIQWVRSLLEGRGVAFGAKLSGKLKTTVQCVAIGAILLTLSSRPAPTWLILTRDVAIWSAVALTLYSGIAYVGSAWPRLRPDLS